MKCGRGCKVRDEPALERMGQRMRAITRTREPDRLGRCRNEPIGEKTPINETERFHTLVADQNTDRFDERSQCHTIALTKAPNGAGANEGQRQRIGAHDECKVQVSAPIGPDRNRRRRHRRDKRDSLNRDQCTEHRIGQRTAVHRDSDENKPEDQRSQRHRMTHRGAEMPKSPDMTDQRDRARCGMLNEHRECINRTRRRRGASAQLSVETLKPCRELAWIGEHPCHRGKRTGTENDHRSVHRTVHRVGSENSTDDGRLALSLLQRIGKTERTPPTIGRGPLVVRGRAGDDTTPPRLGLDDEQRMRTGNEAVNLCGDPSASEDPPTGDARLAPQTLGECTSRTQLSPSADRLIDEPARGADTVDQDETNDTRDQSDPIDHKQHQREPRPETRNERIAKTQEIAGTQQGYPAGPEVGIQTNAGSV